MNFNSSNRVYAIITEEGRLIIKLSAISNLGWILVALGAGIVFLGVYLIILTTRGI